MTTKNDAPQSGRSAARSATEGPRVLLLQRREQSTEAWGGVINNHMHEGHEAGYDVGFQLTRGAASTTDIAVLTFRPRTNATANET